MSRGNTSPSDALNTTNLRSRCIAALQVAAIHLGVLVDVIKHVNHLILLQRNKGKIPANPTLGKENVNRHY